MMKTPDTVTTAIDDAPVDGSVCLEAGAGTGKMTAGLIQGGSRRVFAITNERDHAMMVRKRLGEADPEHDVDERVAVWEADLRKIPLPANSVDLITAHALFNVLPPKTIPTVISELNRVAEPGCRLIVDDYDPLSSNADVRDLFSVENSAAELSSGHPAQTFYPSAMLQKLFQGYGWIFERERTLLNPVPWTERYLEAHATATFKSTESLPDYLRNPLVAEAARLVDSIGEEEIGRMYSLMLRLPE